MPCGGIYPIQGSWVEPIEKMSKTPPWCFHCGKTEPYPDHFIDEWDANIHRECIPAFLMGEDGQIVMNHGHSVHIAAKQM